MKKIFTSIVFLGFQFICLAQVPTKIKILEAKKIIKDDTKDKKVSYEITLNQISIAEATRNTIDNNDCRKTWGEVTVRFYELDANGQLDLNKLIPTDLGEENLFRKVIQEPSHRSKSYYQDRMGVSNDEYIKRISVRVSENMVKNRRIVAKVSCQIKTAHKDNDFATYDILRMRSLVSTTFYLEDLPSKEESMSTITNGTSTLGHDTNGTVVEIVGGGGSDDSHRIWLHFIIKKKS